MAKKGGASVYIDLQMKQVIDIVAPIMGSSLSDIINSAMEQYLNENSPLDIIDSKILKLESELAALRLEREKLAGSLKLCDYVEQKNQEMMEQKHKEDIELSKLRTSKLSNPETIRSLTFQIKHKTIDWNVIKKNFSYDSAIDAREGILTHLLEIKTITPDDSKGV